MHFKYIESETSPQHPLVGSGLKNLIQPENTTTVSILIFDHKCIQVGK